MSNFRQPKSKYDHFPELTGYKARHIRYLVPVIMEIAKEFKKDDDEYSQHRFQCLFHLNGMYQCIDSSGMHVDANTWKLFKHHTDRTLLHYSRLEYSPQVPSGGSHARPSQVFEPQICFNLCRRNNDWPYVQVCPLLLEWHTCPPGAREGSLALQTWVPPQVLAWLR